MNKILVLGAGMVGSAIVKDLLADYDISVIDINKKNLESLKNYKSIKIINADLSDSSIIKKFCKDYDLVVSAVPGFMGFKVLTEVIKCGKDVVDISFFSEDPFKLDKLAKEKKVTAIVDCGVAPGMSNMILGYHNSKMKVDSFKCYVGGLPFERTLPFQYKAPFSPVDVIEEYIRPARIVENRKLLIKPALSESEHINFDNAGTLEAFNTDGLRSLLKTMKIPHMVEKTLRYPGHIEYIMVLRDTGFFDHKKIKLNGYKIAPIELTTKLLLPHWKRKANEKEFTVMRIIIHGIEKSANKEYRYDLYDEFDEKTKTSSMARTTGYTCTAAVRLVLKKKFIRKGISPPEYIGAQPGCFAEVIKDLAKRNIIYRKSERVIHNK